MRTIFIIIFLCFSCSLVAQESDKGFPRPLLPNREETIAIEALTDTVWMLTNNQYKTAIKIAEKQKIDSSLVLIFEQKIDLLNEICAEKDSLITLNRRGYFHYRDLWADTDQKLEQAEIKNAGRWKLAISGFCVGIGFTSLVFIAMRQITL